MALIDAVAFLGQSLSFRIDLASRENFIELAERKESVLRLAKMLSYNAKRNKPAQGLLKFSSVNTTEDIVDSNGKNLSGQTVSWNDPTNTNWLEQFLLILNASMTDNTEFGRSQGSATIQGIIAEQYRFRTASADVPIYTFSKTVAGRAMVFDIISTSFKNSESIYEEAPTPGNQLGYVYRNDGTGPASPNTGFFIMFKQGSLELADFSIAVPATNERIAVDSPNINEDDVWLFSLNSVGAQLGQWAKVSSLIGNNIAYNSVSRSIRNIYSIETKEDDRIDLVFADGVYGNLPQGNFRVYYRVSNGLTYTISPNELRGINISVPYISKAGALHTITIGLSLQSTVTSATASEDIDTIRANAPAQYYTQNRMITGEDYNLAPLTSSQNILKIKSVNRTSSGISRNFEIIDASGKYSDVTVFADDGYVFKRDAETQLSYKFNGSVEIINFIKQDLEGYFTDTSVYNFYLTKFDKILFTDNNSLWENSTTEINLNTGYFKNAVDNTLLKVGEYATNSLKYLKFGALIKFVPPPGKAFKKGQIVTADANDPTQTDRLWTKVISVVGDGTNAGRGNLASGLGPISFTDVIPTSAIASQIVPPLVTDLTNAVEFEILNQISQNLNFGLRFNPLTSTWNIITSSNLNTIDTFALGRAGDVSNNGLDSSWLIAFIKEADQYVIRIRQLEYVFGSVAQNRFYFDSNEKQYNDPQGKVVKDQINVLSINTSSDFITPLKFDYTFEISDSIKFDDGYESTSEILLGFADSDDDGVIDNPETFVEIVGEDTALNYLFFQKTVGDDGSTTFSLIDNSTDTILIYQKESLINVNDFSNGQLIYFYDANEDVVKRVNSNTNTFDLANEYQGFIGRSGLKFQYIHNASVDRRIDPSVSNIIDIYLLTRSYDTDFRTWLAGGLLSEPEAPTSDNLRVGFGSKLNSIKAISDDIIYHPVKYKVLFGAKADAKLQAQFKVVKNPSQSVNDNDLKVRIITAINEFFDINNWDFGDKFYLSELTTYILNQTAPDISNLIIVPKQTNQTFGSLFEIQSNVDEILISGATVDDVKIVTAITAAEIGAEINTIVTTT
jgi:hypothetical protein